MAAEPPKPEPPKPEPAENKTADLQTLMCVMDLAEQNRNRLQEQGREENPEQIALNKEALAAQLRAHYQRQGILMPEEAILEAVDEFTASQCRFQNTLTGLQAGVARVYIKRGPILAVGAVFCLLIAGAAAVMVHENHALRHAKAESVIQRLSDLERRVSGLGQSAATEHDAQAQIETQARQLLAQNTGLTALESTLKVWREAEKADYDAFRQQTTALQNRLGEVKTVMESRVDPPVKVSDHEDAVLSEADAGIEPADRKLQSIRARLKDERMALRGWTMEREQTGRASRLDGLNPVETQSFTANLSAAEASLQGARYEEALAKLEDNRKLLAGADQRARQQAEQQARLADTSTRLTALLQKVRAEATDPQTKTELENRIKAGQIDLAVGDLETMSAKLKSLERIEAILNSSFHLRITTGPKTGVQRSVKSTRAQQWYIIVEATDDNHNRVSYPITSSETGRTANVSIWAEAAPDNVMQELKREKLARGFISNPEFGFKRRGTLQIEYTRIDHPIGQITSW